MRQTSAVTKVSTSFVQDEKHLTKSDKFQPVQPSMLAETLAGFGYVLTKLHTGKARNADRADHQTTIARYRASDALQGIVSGGQPVFADIVFKVPHLYGAILGYIAFFRQVCKNGAVRQIGQFDSIRVTHLGDPVSQLNTLLPQLTGQVDAMSDEIRAMQARQVTPSEIAHLAKAIADIRLANIEKPINVNYSSLIKVRRVEDQPTDLFTVTQVMQENTMRWPLAYQKLVEDQNGSILKNQTARPVGFKSGQDVESVRSVDVNIAIWNEALKLLK
jgi:hypothetical protein